MSLYQARHESWGLESFRCVRTYQSHNVIGSFVEYFVDDRLPMLGRLCLVQHGTALRDVNRQRSLSDAFVNIPR